MTDILFDMGSWILLMLGGFICISGGIGILRFPDFYTRMHAAGVTDTLGAGLILVALMLQATQVIVLFKLVFILLFILLTGPTSCHALAKAAIQGRLKPLLYGDDGASQGNLPSN